MHTPHRLPKANTRVRFPSSAPHLPWLSPVCPRTVECCGFPVAERLAGPATPAPTRQHVDDHVASMDKLNSQRRQGSSTSRAKPLRLREVIVWQLPLPGEGCGPLDLLPGVFASKLALAATAELSSRTTDQHFYRTVWRTDDGVISAGFGLARAQSVAGERDAAVKTLNQVPAASRHFTTARLTSAVTLLPGRSVTDRQELRLTRRGRTTFSCRRLRHPGRCRFDRCPQGRVGRLRRRRRCPQRAHRRRRSSGWCRSCPHTG